MSVRIKTLIVICLTFLVLLGILYFTSRWFLFQDATTAEEKSTSRDIARLLATLDGQIAGVDTTVEDWAQWDDTYKFINNGDAGYIDSNLPNSAFINLEVELMLFINNSGQIVFGKMVDLDNEAEIPVPESLYSELQVSSRLLSHKDPSDKMTGILSLPEGPMIISSQPIVTSQGEGPIRGTLIMGQFLDEAEIAKLSQMTQLSISAFPYKNDGAPDDAARARKSLVGVRPIFVAPQSEAVVSGYTLVYDVYGNPALILRVDTPREAFTQAKISMRYLGLALLAIGIILGLVTMVLLERMVIVRLTSLNSSVIKIGKQGTASSRVEAKGNDEIFVLATSVNSMLDSLENSRAKERESEERYKKLATISPVGIFRTDQSGATTYVNPMWCHITGLSVDEALGYGWLSAVHPEDKESLTKSWQETTQLHKASFADYRFVRPDGTVAWVMGQAIPEMNSENQTVGYVGTITDITERKLAEEALAEREQRLASIYSTVEDVIFQLAVEEDSHYRFTSVNPAFLATTGLTSAQVIGKRVDEVIPEPSLSMVLEKYATATREKGIVRWEETSEYPTGRLIGEVSVAPIFDESGHCTHLVGAVHDITERKQGEELLRASEERFAKSFHANPIAVCVSAFPDGQMVEVNEAFLRLIGYKREEVIGRSGPELNLWNDPETRTSIIRELLESGSVRDREGQMRAKSGPLRDILASAEIIQLGGQPHALIMLSDITERKQAEKAIRHHLAELEVLAENSASLSRLLSPKEISQKIIEILSRKLAWHHIAIRLYHPETGIVEVLALSHPGLSAIEIEKQIVRLNQIISRPGKGLSGWVIKHGKPVRSGQVKGDRRYVQTYPGVQSGIYVPIQLGGRTIGSISVESESENAFTEQDEHLLATLTSQAAIAFENARLYQEAVQAAERRTILHRASQEIAAAGLDLEAVYTAIHQAAAKMMSVDVFTIGLYDLERQDVEAVFLLDGGQRYPNLRIPLGQGFSGLAIQNRKTLRLKDRHEEALAQAISFGQKRATRSVLAVPVFSGNAVIGAISIQSYKVDEYDEEDEAMLEMLAAHAGNAIENARLFDQTRRHADELGMLASISSALRVSITRGEIIPVILDYLIDLLNADDAALSTLDLATGENVIEQARGEWAKVIGLRLKAGEGLIGGMAETYTPYEGSAVTQEKNLGFPDSTSQPEVVAGIPLLVEGQFVGSLWVGRQQAKGEEMPVPFAPDEIRLLGSVADMAANGLHRAKLHEQAIRHAEQLVTVNKIGHLLGETLELNQIYIRLTEAIYNLLPDICGLLISLYDQHLQNITHVCGHFEGAFIDPTELLHLPLDRHGERHQRHVILTGEPLTTDDIDTRPFISTAHKPAGGSKQTARSGLYVPMIARGITIGLIQLQSNTKGRFGQEEINLLSLVANTAAVAIENARLLAETQKRLHNLSALHTIDTAIGASVDIHVTLNILLEQTAAELKADAAAVLLLNPLTRTLEYTASYGFRGHLVNRTRIQLGSGVAGQAALTRQMQSISDQRGMPPSRERQKSTPNVYEGEEFVTHFAFPLVAKGQVQGVLEVYHRSPFQPDEEWLTFFNMLAGQAAIAIDNAHLFEDLQRSNLDTVLAYDATLQGWSQSLELRDKGTEGHAQRVTDLTLRLAQMIGVPDAEIEHVRRGTLLHDIGKIGIPDSILLKPGKLTKEEWNIMRCHPVRAYEMLSSIAYLRPALDIPHYHHEKWDGSGYPDRLKGERIPLYARIFAVVNVYDALTSNRPYRPAWTVERAIEYIRKQSGKHFDPKIVEAFLNLISEGK